MIYMTIACMAMIVTITFAMHASTGITVSNNDSVTTVTTQEIVVTGSPFGSTRNKSIHRVRLMDSTRIASQQAVSLRDVLTTELNIGVHNDAILGSGTTIQGIGGNGVKVLIDGVPVTGRLDWNIDISQILLGNAERVEIVEGPMAVMYGSDAIGGVINVVSKQLYNNKFHGSIHAYTESVGSFNTSAVMNGSIGETKLSLNGARNLFDGWSSNKSYKRFAEWKPREQYLLDFRLQPAWQNVTMHYDIHAFTETILNRGEPRAPFGEMAFDDEYITRRLINSATATWNVAPDISSTGTAAVTLYRREKLSTVKDLVTLFRQPTLGAGDQDTTTMTTAMLRLITSVGRDTSMSNLSFGFEGTAESMRSTRLTASTASMTDAAAFAEFKWSMSKLLAVQAGGRMLWNSKFGLFAVPSLHAIWKPTAFSTLRFSAAQGYRSPSLRELYLYFVDINHDIVGNALLRPEYSTSVNASASILWNDSSRAIRVEPAAYVNDVQNLITLSQLEGTQQYTYVNIGRMLTAGAQLSFVYSTESLEVAVGGALVATSSSIGTMHINALQWSPQATTTLRYELPLTASILSVFVKYNGQSIRPIQTSSNTTTTQVTDPYTMMDVVVGHHFFNSVMTLSVGCKNVMDVTSIGISAQSGTHGPGTSQPVGMGRLFTADIVVHIQ